MKILIVDDKEEDLYLLKTLLEGNGYEVASAVNGVEALEKLRGNGFDMIISDILMPKMDGFRLCREVKKNRKLKQIAMVFYTATYTEPSDEEFALNLGVERFIVKPTEPDALMEILKEVIKNHEMGTLVAPRQPIEDETVYLTEYNERLIRKMEDKMLELKRVNMVLGDSEEKYKDLIDNANDAVIVFDQEGYIGFVNPKFCEMTGYSVGEAKTLHFNKLVHPDDVGMVKEYVSKRMAGETVPRNYEVRLLTRTGQTMYMDNNAGSIEKEGRIIGVLNIMRDITKRKEAEEALRVTSKKREELEDIINHSPAVIFLWRAAEGWPVEFVSDNVRQFGYTPEDFYSGRILFLNIVHPDDLERVAAEVGKFSQEGCKDFNQEYRIITKLEDVCWIDNRIWARRDANGVITHYQGIILDISKRKQAEEEILMLAHTIRNINVCISISDMDNNIISVNKAFCDVYGYKEEEILGKNTSILWSSLAPESLTREILPQTLKGGWQGEFYNKRKDGSDFPIYLSTSVIGDENGKPIAMVGVSRDITEQKLAQEEKESLQDQLRQAQKMEAIGTLAGGIAHDFNNILTPILGYTDMVIDEVPEDSRIRADMEKVIKAANRAKDLVQQILTFSRQVEQERKPVKIHLIVQEALKLLRATLPATIEIRQHIDCECRAVLADPTQIHQVLINLCTNAYHAMRESGGVIEVSLGMVEISAELAMNYPNLHEGTYVRLTVGDTGHGMDRATMERVFEPFFTTKGVGEGTGLGLSVVHGIVVSHGGEITIESELGKGTRFHVHLPRVDSDVERETPRDEPIPEGKERILFVDDEEEIARMGERMLERLGYDVTMRTSSVEALESFRLQPDGFDLVITDQTMPNMTGVEFVGELLRIRPDLPTILMTGFSEMVTPETAKKIGIREFLMKPIVILDLGKAIRRVLNSKNENETYPSG